MVKDLQHLFSKEAKARQPSKLKTISHYRALPDFAFLGSGLPLPESFAWSSIGATTRKSPFEGGMVTDVKKEDELEFKVYSESDGPADIPLNESLQYGGALGPKAFRDFIVEHTKIVHKIPHEDWGIIPTVGSTQSWESCVRTFCDPGDLVLVENYAYASATEAVIPLGIGLKAMSADDDGIIPEKLEAQLAGYKERGAKIPKIIYTVPTGQNPTGTCLPAERRKAIYDIACKYDIVIVEDEPYYFLQLDPYVEPSSRTTSPRLDTQQFLDSLVPSFLNFDTEGRVLRLDSFSKIMAPGSRLGWVTGQKQVIERLERLYEASIQTPSGFASTIVQGTLSRWGQDGFLEWLKAVRENYTAKRDVAIDAARKYLPLDICHCQAVKAGMFFTIQIDAAIHPEFESKFGSDPKKLEKEVYETIIKHKSLLVPGSWFEVEDEDLESTTHFFFRGTFAATDAPTIEKGIQRTGDAIREVFQL